MGPGSVGDKYCKVHVQYLDPETGRFFSDHAMTKQQRRCILEPVQNFTKSYSTDERNYSIETVSTVWQAPCCRDSEAKQSSHTTFDTSRPQTILNEQLVPLRPSP
jgi:hypothetical protein